MFLTVEKERKFGVEGDWLGGGVGGLLLSVREAWSLRRGGGGIVLANQNRQVL